DRRETRWRARPRWTPGGWCAGFEPATAGVARRGHRGAAGRSPSRAPKTAARGADAIPPVHRCRPPVARRFAPPARAAACHGHRRGALRARVPSIASRGGRARLRAPAGDRTSTPSEPALHRLPAESDVLPPRRRPPLRCERRLDPALRFPNERQERGEARARARLAATVARRHLRLQRPTAPPPASATGATDARWRPATRRHFPTGATAPACFG